MEFEKMFERFTQFNTWVGSLLYIGLFVGLFFLLKKFISKPIFYIVYFVGLCASMITYWFSFDLLSISLLLMVVIAMVTTIFLNAGAFRPYLYNAAPDKIFKKKNKVKKNVKPILYDKDIIVNEITEAVLYCSQLNQKKNLEFRIQNSKDNKPSGGISAAGIGLFIVFERNNDVTASFTPGFTQFDSEVSAKLIETIFYEGTQLHDGALIIRNGRIFAAGAFVTQSTSDSIVEKFGARHRAAKGISQATDCISLVVSEETGGISFFVSGEEIPVYREDFEKKLRELYDSPVISK